MGGATKRKASCYDLSFVTQPERAHANPNARVVAAPTGLLGTSARLQGTRTEIVLRRLRIVGALVVVGTAVATYSLPRLAAQSAQARGSVNSPIVVASGVAVRSLAVRPTA